MSTGKKVAISIAVILVVLAVAAVLLGYFTDWFTNWDDIENIVPTPGKTPAQEKMRVLLNGAELKSGDILPEAELTLVVENGGDFTVEIVPGAEFDFRADDALYRFPVDGDWSAAFGLTIDGSNVTVNSERSLARVIEAGTEFAGKLDGFSEIDEEKTYFFVVISSEKETIKLGLTGFYGFYKIEFDKEVIYI